MFRPFTPQPSRHSLHAPRSTRTYLRTQTAMILPRLKARVKGYAFQPIFHGAGSRVAITKFSRFQIELDFIVEETSSRRDNQSHRPRRILGICSDFAASQRHRVNEASTCTQYSQPIDGYRSSVACLPPSHSLFLHICIFLDKTACRDKMESGERFSKQIE